MKYLGKPFSRKHNPAETDSVINATLLLSDSLAARLSSSSTIPYTLLNAWIERDIREQVTRIATRLSEPPMDQLILKWSCTWPVVVIHVPKSATTVVLERLRAMPEICHPHLLPRRELGIAL